MSCSDPRIGCTVCSSSTYLDIPKMLLQNQDVSVDIYTLFSLTFLILLHHQVYAYSNDLTLRAFSHKPGTAFSTSKRDTYFQTTLDWTWIEGSKLYNLSSQFHRNDTTILESPGARGGSAFWVDSHQRLWVFGGFGFGSDNTVAEPYFLDDLWLFDTPNKLWSPLQQRTTDGHHAPPARRHAAGCGVSDIMFVLYGGHGQDRQALNDTWIYILANQTWVSLDDKLRSLPPERFDMVSWCLEDRLIVFGGLDSEYNIQPDFWQFTFHNLVWEKVLMKLEHFTDDAYNHVYPAPRNGATSWFGPNNTMYLFGGNVKSGKSPDVQDSAGFVSDLWQLEFHEKEFKWTYIRGYTKTPCVNMGIYGKLGFGEETTMPGCRVSAASWIDMAGNLYMLGGKGVDSVAYPEAENEAKYLSDVWEYNLLKQQWIWVGGATHGNAVSHHGKLGIFQPENEIGSRSHAIVWPTSQNNTFYLFGGVRLAVDGNLGYLNDLWRITIGLKESSDLVFLLPFSSGVLFLVCFSGIMTVAILFGLGVFLKKCIDFPRHSPSRSPERDYHVKYSPLSNDHSLEIS